MDKTLNDYLNQIDIEDKISQMVAEKVRATIPDFEAKIAKDLLKSLLMVRGADGDDGKTPTKEELVSLIKPLIPKPIPGKDYVLTSQDKKVIAQSVKVPVIEKVIEKTEVIREQPIITKEIVEVAIYETPEQIKEKIESLPIKGRWFDFRHLKNVPVPLGKKGGGGDTVLRHDLSSQLDGSTKTFTIPKNKKIILVVGSSAPFIFRQTIDYTRTETSLIFDSAIDATLSLASGQSLELIYV